MFFICPSLSLFGDSIRLSYLLKKRKRSIKTKKTLTSEKENNYNMQVPIILKNSGSTFRA